VRKLGKVCFLPHKVTAPTLVAPGDPENGFSWQRPLRGTVRGNDRERGWMACRTLWEQKTKTFQRVNVLQEDKLILLCHLNKFYIVKIYKSINMLIIAIS